MVQSTVCTSSTYIQWHCCPDTNTCARSVLVMQHTNTISTRPKVTKTPLPSGYAAAPVEPCCTISQTDWPVHRTDNLQRDHHGQRLHATNQTEAPPRDASTAAGCRREAARHELCVWRAAIMPVSATPGCLRRASCPPGNQPGSLTGWAHPARQHR